MVLLRPTGHSALLSRQVAWLEASHGTRHGRHVDAAHVMLTSLHGRLIDAGHIVLTAGQAHVRRVILLEDSHGPIFVRFFYAHMHQLMVHRLERLVDRWLQH